MNTVNPKHESKVFKTITNESFIEKIILLLASVFISGLLIPYIANEIQRNKSRNETILQAQSKLLDDISQTILTDETLLLDISWYGSTRGANPEMQKKSFERYSERSVDLITQWRIQSLRAKNLASQEISNRLDSFQVEMFRLQDEPTNTLYRTKAMPKDWDELHYQNEGMLRSARNLLSQLAIEMNITKNSLK